MSNRKLAQEVERTIKKVNEGVELFDEILDKVYTAPSASQRDKFEGELKKEIKKLQRLREQIRAWIGGSEVKDKTELLEKRKVIEARMEKFKICEQKTKMKAYSKEALSQKQVQSRKKSKVIPETEEKKEARNWISECQEAIQAQIGMCDTVGLSWVWNFYFLFFTVFFPRIGQINTPVQWIAIVFKNVMQQSWW